MQPSELLPTTEKSVAFKGFAEILDALLPPGVQVYPNPPEAVMVTKAPCQINEELDAMLIVGTGFATKVKLATPEHVPSVTDTV